MLTPTELREYIAVMRETGVISLKLESLELVLNPMHGSAPGKISPLDGPLSADDYEKFQFAATEGFPDDEAPPQ